MIYTVTSGTATLACGLPTCSVTATGDGRASMNVTAVDGTWSIVTASLTNGSSLQAQFRRRNAARPRFSHARSFRSPPEPASPGPSRRWFSPTAFPPPAKP